MGENGKTRRDRIRGVISNRNPPRTKGKFDTSDLIQETELQLWKQGLDPFVDDYSEVPQSYLASIANGHLAKQLRKHHTLKRNAELERPISDNFLSGGPEPSGRIEAKELARQIAEAISMLEEESRRILFLRYYRGLTFKEICQEMGLTGQQIKTEFSRAIRDMELILRSKQDGND